MISLTIKKYIVVFLLVIFPTAACAQEIKLYKKGQRVTLTEDLHCMNNAAAIKVLDTIKFCPINCRLQLEKADKLHGIDLNTCNSKILLQDKKYSDILHEKDRTIDKVQVAALDEISKIESSLWWKITLGVLGGAAVGAGVTAVVMTFME